MRLESPFFIPRRISAALVSSKYVALFSLVLAAGCGSSSSGGSGTSTGGTTSSGGESSTGGSTAATGGVTGTGGGTTATGGTTSAGTGGSSGTSTDAGEPTRCDDDAGGVADAVCVYGINGRVIDQSGAPVATRDLVSACGPANCNPGFTNSAGKFLIPVGFHLITSGYSVQVHVRPDFAAFYYALPASSPGPNIDMGDLRVLAMPTTGPLLQVDRAGTPAQSVTSSDVTLHVGDGVYVRLDVESDAAPGDTGKQFRVLRIPDALMSEYTAGTTGIAAMYAIEPFESSFEVGGMPNDAVKVQLSFANATNLPASSAVDVLELGSYVYPDWITPAQFTKVASAHVSADGKTIAMDAGEGVLHLTWAALKPAS